MAEGTDARIVEGRGAKSRLFLEHHRFVRPPKAEFAPLDNETVDIGADFALLEIGEQLQGELSQRTPNAPAELARRSPAVEKRRPT